MTSEFQRWRRKWEAQQANAPVANTNRTTPTGNYLSGHLYGKLVATSPGDAEDGKWMFTEYCYDSALADWVESKHPPGHQNYEFAYEINGSTANSEGDLVHAWKGQVGDGTPCLFFDGGAGAEILFAKVSSGGWTDNRPASYCTVNAYPCDNADLDNPEEAAIDIKSPVPDGKDPLYFEDDPIAYVADPTDPATYVSIDTWFDDRIGTLKVWHDPADIPKGWQAADGTNGTKDLRGRFIVGYKDGGLTSSDESNGLGDEGDYAAIGAEANPNYTHGHSLQAGLHDIDYGTDDNYYACVTSYTDHRPPYYVVIWIERTS